MGWPDDLYRRLVHGDDPGDIMDAYRAHVAAEERAARYTPIPRRHLDIMRAFEGAPRDGEGPMTSDWAALENHGALDDQGRLTSDATRIVLDTWDTMEAQSDA